MYSIRSCRYCKVGFKPYSSNEALCQPCRRPKCGYCKERFTITQVANNPKFCTRRCSLSALYGTSKLCVECGKKVPKKSFKFCSKKCLRRIHQRRRMRSFSEERRKAIRGFGGKCSRCGFSNIDALELHHVDRSRKIRFKSPHRHNISFRMRDFRKNPDNFEVLCANCHRIETHSSVWSLQKKLSYLEQKVEDKAFRKILLGHKRLRQN